MAKGRVVIAYIHPGQVSAYFTGSLVATVLTGYREGWLANILEEGSSANVSAARNSLTRQFLESDLGDWLLWIDSDMQWDPSAVTDLLAVAHWKRAPIVGGLCFGMMADKPSPTIYKLVQMPDGLTTGRLGVYQRDAVMPVDATGAAFLLIHRDALKQIRDQGFNPAFPWFQETQIGDKPVGEDITFCLRARQVGIPIYVHTGVKIGHHKSHLITEATFDEAVNPAMPPGVGLVIPTRGDHPELLRAIIAASGLPPELVVLVSNGDGPLPDGDLPATKIHDPGPPNIHRWWNLGIDHLAAAGCTRVAVLNDDLVIAPDTLPRMARALGGATLALLDVDGPSGHCWMLNVTHGVRPDESYRWYAGDLQLIADAQTRGRGVVRVPEAWCLHMHPTEATEASPTLTALAAADDALYDSRHPAGSPFAAIRPAEESA